jgi:hypothetical protein
MSFDLRRIVSLILKIKKPKPKTVYSPYNPWKGKYGYPKHGDRVECGCGLVHVMGRLPEKYCPRCGYLVFRERGLAGTKANYFPKKGEAGYEAAFERGVLNA